MRAAYTGTSASLRGATLTAPEPLAQALAERDERPIGVFDSGVGGLTILKELFRELPDERYLYFGDTGNCPYGVRPEAEIQRLALAAARYLLERRAKIIVVACNTASVAALKELRAAYPAPFVGVVPAVKPAAERTRTGVIGIASTEASARGGYLKRLIEEHASGVRAISVGCPRLVTMAEVGVLDGLEAEAAIREYIGPMLAQNIDVLVLGCTHFPAMRAAFERVVGPDVAIIDSGAAIARQTRRILEERCALAMPGAHPADAPRAPRASDEFRCSGDAASFSRVATAILGESITAACVPGMLAGADPPGQHSGHMPTGFISHTTGVIAPAHERRQPGE
jgi:glutamate racemase